MHAREASQAHAPLFLQMPMLMPMPIPHEPYPCPQRRSHARSYGEFVEEKEPCDVGAHLVAGSLIKNPGGTLAPTGGYIAGRADLVAAAGRRLSAPGVEGGATLGMNRLLFQGLFNSAQVVGEALKGAQLVAHVMDRLGYACNPPAGSNRTDIIQAVQLGRREKVPSAATAASPCCRLATG